MCGTIESRFMSINDQRLFDQKAIDVAVTSNDSKIYPVHVMTGCFFVFGNGRGGVDIFLSFGRRMETVERRSCWSPE